jgi:drug/metabolite transporter (DMT)-like permease
MFFVILLYALFASVFTISKTGLEYTQPFFLIGSRMILAGILMLAYQWFRNPSEFSFDKSRCWRIFRLALFNIYLTNAFEFWGLKYLTSFKTCFIYSLSPFLSALFSYFILAENMSYKKWLGLLVGFAGFIPILLNQTSTEEAAGHFAIFSWPELAVMIAAACSVYGWIILGQLVKENGYSPFMANGLSMLIGGIFALVHSALVENWDPLPLTEFVPFFECILALILISNLICYNLYGWLLKNYSATFMSFAGFTTPLFTALFGWIFLGEVVTWPFYVSSAIVFAGLTLFYQEELKSTTTADQTPNAQVEA